MSWIKRPRRRRGPDLTAGRWVHGSSDADIFRTITRGVPGTEMPANGFEDSETWAILAYIRSLAPAKSAVSGDPPKGRRFSGKRRDARPATWCRGAAECLARIYLM